MIKESMYFPKNSGVGKSIEGFYKELGVKEGDEAVVLLSKEVAEYFHIDDNGLVKARVLILSGDEAEDIGAAVAKELIPWCGQNHPEPTLHGIHVRIFGYDYGAGNYKEIMKVDNYGQINNIEKVVTEYYRKIRD